MSAVSHPASNLHVRLLGAVAEGAAGLAIRAVRWSVAHKVRSVLLVLAITGSLVSAQVADDATPQVQTQTATSYEGDMRDTNAMMSRIASVVNGVLANLATNSTLQGVGNTMKAFFFAAMFVWAGLKTLAGGRGLGEWIGELVPVFIGFGMVTLFLDQNAGQAVVSTMDMVAGAIAGASMSSLDSAIRAGAEPIFKAIAAVVAQPRVAEGASGSGLSGWIEGMAAGLASWLYAAIAKVITAIVLTFAGVIMLGHIIMGFISIKLVLALAPMMVPFLMFPPASWLFDSWLKFLLGACMLKVVVALLLTMVGGLIDAMSGLSRAFYLDAQKVTPMEALQVDILQLGMVMVFALLAALLMHQAPTIASGLLSGNAGGAGFQGMRGITQSAAGRVSAAGMGAGARGSAQAANGVGRAANIAVGGYVGYKQGAAQGQRGAVLDLQGKTGVRDWAQQKGYASGQSKFIGPLKPQQPAARN